MNEPPTPPASPPPEKPEYISNAQWLCYFVIVFAFYLLASRPANTTAQLVFRLALLLGGLIGLLIIWLKRRKRDH